jgi:hypothetical protein
MVRLTEEFRREALAIALAVKSPSGSSTMDKAIFQRRFEEATESAVTFARHYVINVLPEGRLFLIYTNQSYDGNPLKSDETLYSGDSLPTGSNPLSRSAEDAIDFLWRCGKIPEWIDVSVERIEEGNTFLRLLCCGRFTADERLLYYPDTTTPGFGIKSPDFPPNWLPSSKSVKFDLHWRVKVVRPTNPFEPTDQ